MVVGPGRPLFLDEARVSADGCSARVVGRLVHFDAARATARLEQRGVTLDIDFSFLDPLPQCTQGDLLCCIGELAAPAEVACAPVLRARVASIVSGLSLDAYERAVEARRTFLREVEVAPAPSSLETSVSRPPESHR